MPTSTRPIVIAPRPDLRDARRPGGADLLGAVAVGIVLIDPNGLVSCANTSAEQLLNRSQRLMVGLPLGDLLGLSVMDVVSRDDDVAIYDAEVAAGGGTLRLDITSSRIIDWPGWRAVTLHAAGPGHLAERAETGRVAVGAAAMLAHEIKNPLSGIRGAAQLLGPGKLSALIVREVDRVAALIDRMQPFTDVHPPALVPGNVHSVLAHARRLALAGVARDIPVEERYDPSLPLALIDHDELTQVLLNLLRNASEALVDTAKPLITITTGYRHGTVRRAVGDRSPTTLPIEICVIDNGPGAPPDIAGQLFEPFVSGRRDGTGLGLAIVDKLVRDMGGMVRHAREGDRTVFRILLARAPA